MFTAEEREGNKYYNNTHNCLILQKLCGAVIIHDTSDITITINKTFASSTCVHAFSCDLENHLQEFGAITEVVGHNIYFPIGKNVCSRNPGQPLSQQNNTYSIVCNNFIHTL